MNTTFVFLKKKEEKKRKTYPYIWKKYDFKTIASEK